MSYSEIKQDMQERLEKTVCYLESALNIVQQKENKKIDKPLLDDVIKKAKDIPNTQQSLNYNNSDILR